MIVCSRIIYNAIVLGVLQRN